MRGLKSTLVLIAILAGLGAYIYFVDSKRPAGGIEPKAKVFTVESDKIEEIRLKSEGQTSVLQKKDGNWLLAEPAAAEVDQNEASTLASNISTLELNRVIDENATDLAKYGLADPRIAIEFKGQGGAAGAIHIGEKTPTSSDVYAVRPGEKRVFLIPAYQETSFNKKPFDFRDKRILRFERDKADLLEITAGTQVTQLARSGSDWVMKQPVQARADYSAVEGLLTRLSSAPMTKIVDGAALDKPAITVTVGAGSARASLAIGEEKDGEVLARDLSRPIVFAVDPSLATDLKKGADEYRNKDVFQFRPFNVSALRIARGSNTYEFKKIPATGPDTSEKWTRSVNGGAAADVDTAKMDDLLSKLSGLRAQSFVADARPADVITVSASYDEGKFERVRLGKAGADATATRDGEPGAAKLDAAAFEGAINALDEIVK